MIKEPGDCKDMEDAGLIQRGQLPRPHQLIIARCNIGPELPDLCNLFREAGISGFFFFFFGAVLGLHCWARASSSCGERGLLNHGVQASHCDGFSFRTAPASVVVTLVL